MTNAKTTHIPVETNGKTRTQPASSRSRTSTLINKSNYISRDLSWLQFNDRVLDQARTPSRTIFERLKFLAITASNLDEFFMIRVGSLYNYIDYSKERVDYSGLRERPFKKILFEAIQAFTKTQHQCFQQELLPEFSKNGLQIAKVSELRPEEQAQVANYFMYTLFPMLTPMAYDNYRSFPLLMNKLMCFGVVTKGSSVDKEEERLSFVQIPQNLPRFYEIDREDTLVFVPIEEIIRTHIDKLYRNIEILQLSLFRITRNGDITLEESDDIEQDFIDEIKIKLKTRKTGRAVRIEVERGFSERTIRTLRKRWGLEEDNIFVTDSLLDYTGLFQIALHDEFRDRIPSISPSVAPVGMNEPDVDIFELIKKQDLLLHHPFNSFEPVLELLEAAAEDEDVLAIKITIYRLSKNSRVSTALLKAAENGKHVSVLFELKARFDEENNIREAERLQKAGCFVIYGFNRYKTHTKLMLIVRKEDNQVVRYVHMSSGNYNESTARLYTDIGLLSAREGYGQDISEFFNVITGHSQPLGYRNLITSPNTMRDALIALLRREAENAAKGLACGVVIKINSLEDQRIIDELYLASQAGVPIKLIVRGICCLRPQRKGLSENIEVISLVGDLLEHSRIYYFHNNGKPQVYGGSADAMVRSFDRRIESLFLITDESVLSQIITILDINLKDNVNGYVMQEDGSYVHKVPAAGEVLVNLHEAFFDMQGLLQQPTQLFMDKKTR
ncbi:polyphosphate kinase 1 [Eisenibacter elegans]|uniref:polyphosphate kinase 1 n=1 Tax=Eisenibacter elegans TaxID=997 RepID=UPI00042A67E7|nr:polyphosphate kinase 1 [Eisenibacter elegans]